MVGAVLGSYRLVQKLGNGGMGAVYLGQHQLLGRRAAIKVLLPELSARPEVVQRFFNEARAVTSISDPGIVQVFDFGYHTDGSAFIVMEYLEGEPLDRRLARLGRLPAHEALRLARQLAISLAAAHAQHIVHRDLKPENVFLVPDAEVASGERSKILDFGIAKLSDDHPGKIKTSTGALMGTPLYMSPEQCRGLAEIDHRSDIYSLGCVLFSLLTGRPPFDGEAPGDIIAAHIREPAPSPSSRAPELPPQIDALVLRCLARVPGDRFQTMAELAAAVDAVLPQLSAGAAAGALAHMVPTTKLPAGVPPVLPDARAPGAGTGPRTPTTLGASSGQLTPSGRMVLPGTPALAGRPVSSGSPGSRDRRVGLWIAGGLIIAAAGIGIAIVGAGDSGGMRVASGPNPAVTEGAPPPSGSGSPAVEPARATPPAGTTPPPAATTLDAPAAGAPASNPSATANEPAQRTDAGATAGAGTPTDALQPANHEARPAREAEAPAGASSKKPPHHKRPVVDAPRRKETLSSTPAPLASTAPPAGKPTPGQCSKAVFAAVYNGAAPSTDEIRAAIRNLNACHKAGVISDAEFDTTQAALVSRF